MHIWYAPLFRVEKPSFQGNKECWESASSYVKTCQSLVVSCAAAEEMSKERIALSGAE